MVSGPEAIKSAVALYCTAFPDVQITVEAVRVEGEMVDLHWAAHRGPPPRAGDAAARADGALRGLTRVRCVADQLVESWTTWDRTGVLHRLGLTVVEEGADDGGGSVEGVTGAARGRYVGVSP